MEKVQVLIRGRGGETASSSLKASSALTLACVT